jgi:hypothetical protein
MTLRKVAATALLGMVAAILGLFLIRASQQERKATNAAVQRVADTLQSLKRDLNMMGANYKVTITTGDPSLDIQVEVDCTTVPASFVGDCAAYFKHLIQRAREEFPNPVTTPQGG